MEVTTTTQKNARLPMMFKINRELVTISKEKLRILRRSHS